MEKNHDDLERYLQGTMSDVEQKAFEQQLEKDATLAEELATHRDVLAGIQLDGSQALKERLRRVETELANEKEPRRMNPREEKRRPLMTWLAVAASLLAMVFLGYLMLPGSGPEDLYVAYYQPYPNLINPAQRSLEVREETVLERAMRAYDGQQYMQALALFEQGNVASASDPGYTFYYAASYLGLNQEQQAIPLLEQVAQRTESLFYRPALWYLALAHLKRGDTATALPYLREVATSEGDYTREAQELLKELE